MNALRIVKVGDPCVTASPDCRIISCPYEAPLPGGGYLENRELSVLQRALWPVEGAAAYWWQSSLEYFLPPVGGFCVPRFLSSQSYSVRSVGGFSVCISSLKYFLLPVGDSSYGRILSSSFRSLIGQNVFFF